MKKIAVLFPGQGSQYAGMYRNLIKREPNISSVMERASEVLKFDLVDMVENGSMKTMTMSENAQPAVVAASYAMYQLFVQELGVLPDYMAGHSLGELSALVCAGSISFEDGITFARARGKLMQQALEDNRGFAGIITDLGVQKVFRAIRKTTSKGYVAITGYNSPDQLMVGGSREAARYLDDEVENMGGQFIPFRMIPMKADAPYHSKLMDYLMPAFRELVVCMTFRKPQVPIWSTVTGRSIQHVREIPGVLISQLVAPVRWSQALHRIMDRGAEMFVDIGPGEIVSNLVREDDRLPPALAFDSEFGRREIAGALADPKWRAYSKMA